MTWEELRAWCVSMPGAEETFPFEPGVSVFKAANGKMFAVSVATSEPLDISVKCDPDIAQALRAEYAAIVEGYHLNKRHWNTVTLDGSIADAEIADMIQDSYDLVAAKLTRSQRDELRAR